MLRQSSGDSASVSTNDLSMLNVWCAQGSERPSPRPRREFLAKSFFRILIVVDIRQDFVTHSRLSDSLLGHFSQAFRDREIYWLARERSKVQKDVLVMILDTFDHTKLALPQYPGRRVPKRAVYESTRRTEAAFTTLVPPLLNSSFV